MKQLKSEVRVRRCRFLMSLLKLNVFLHFDHLTSHFELIPKFLYTRKYKNHNSLETTIDFQCIGSDLHPSAAFLGGADGRMDKIQGVEALLESRIGP